MILESDLFQTNRSNGLIIYVYNDYIVAGLNHCKTQTVAKPKFHAQKELGSFFVKFFLKKA